jgi:hypothetical protein
VAVGEERVVVAGGLDRRVVGGLPALADLAVIAVVRADDLQLVDPQPRALRGLRGGAGARRVRTNSSPSTTGM